MALICWIKLKKNAPESRKLSILIVTQTIFIVYKSNAMDLRGPDAIRAAWEEATVVHDLFRRGMLEARRSGWLALLLILACPALAQEVPVPLFSPEEALKLSHKPISRMLDEDTCEWIAGVRYRAGNGRWQPAAYGSSALFRKGDSREPFMRVTTRQDGVYVARFRARPGEVIRGRAYIIDPTTGHEVYGRGHRLACAAGKVDVGVPLPVKDETEDAVQERSP